MSVNIPGISDGKLISKKFYLIFVMILSAVLLLLLAGSTLSRAIKCSIALGQREDRVACINALFSAENIPLAQLPLFFHWDDICAPTAATRKTNGIAVANRGKCTFEAKARVAEKLGYAGLIVINSNNTIFPMGPSDVNYKSKIPVVMAAETFLNTLQYQALKSNVKDLTEPTEVPGVRFSIIKGIRFHLLIVQCLFTLDIYE